ERMEPELLLQLIELGCRGILHRDPDEGIGATQIFVDRIDRDLGNFLTVLVNDAIDEHGVLGCPACGRGPSRSGPELFAGYAELLEYRDPQLLRLAARESARMRQSHLESRLHACRPR